MAERKQPGKATTGGRRRKAGDPPATDPPPATPTPGGSDSAPGSSASNDRTDGDPLAIEQPPAFEPPPDDRARPAPTPPPDLEPPAPPELIEWTPERAAALVKAGGLVLHNADPIGHEEGGAQLWRATAEDCEAIGSPLARILNRYAPARQLAGYSDEVELTFALGNYTKRNLAQRGRLVREKRAREEEARVEWGPGAPDVVEPGFDVTDRRGTLEDRFGGTDVEPPAPEGDE